MGSELHPQLITWRFDFETVKNMCAREHMRCLTTATFDLEFKFSIHFSGLVSGLADCRAITRVNDYLYCPHERKTTNASHLPFKTFVAGSSSLLLRDRFCPGRLVHDSRHAGDRSLWWGALKKGGQRKVADRLVGKMNTQFIKKAL